MKVQFLNYEFNKNMNKIVSRQIDQTILRFFFSILVVNKKFEIEYKT